MKLDSEHRYINVSKRLLSRYNRETGSNWRRDLTGFIAWFDSKTREWSKSTFRQYRASLVFYFKVYGDSDSMYALERVEKKRRVENGGLSTSQQKDKKISNKDLNKILSFLKGSGSGYSAILSNWLYCGIVTGLRPIEWHESKISHNEKGVFLIVKNAKNSNMRSNGDYRTLDLSNLDYESKVLIERLVNTLSVLNDSDFDKMHKSCSMLLYRTSRKIFPGRKKFPTLYSGRHQFSANAKGTGLQLNEIAALMGHATDRTATEHYGRKVFKNDVVKVAPLESEVNSVRKTYSNDRGEKVKEVKGQIN